MELHTGFEGYHVFMAEVIRGFLDVLSPFVQVLQDQVRYRITGREHVGALMVVHTTPSLLESLT